MFLKLYIKGLTREEQYEIVKKIEIIQHHIYPELDVSYSFLKRNPNTISINQEIPDEEVAFDVFKCLKAINFKHEHDEYYGIYEDVHMELSLEFTNKWDQV